MKWLFDEIDHLRKELEYYTNQGNFRMSRINRQAYEKLIAENIEWLKTIPQTLEREHTIEVLKWSIGELYDGPMKGNTEIDRPLLAEIDRLKNELRSARVNLVASERLRELIPEETEKLEAEIAVTVACTRNAQRLGLRKQALEATGWTNIMPCLHRPLLSGHFPKGARPDGMCDSIGGLLAHLPAVESDPGISEPWFLEWCEKHDIAWEMTCNNPGGTIWLDVADSTTRLNDSCRHTFVNGSTPSECRARAVLAASRSNHEK